METSRRSEKNEVSSERPVDICDWSREHVRQWMLELKVDKEDAEILYNQRINGAGLLELKEAYLLMKRLSNNAIELIITHKDLKKQKTQNDLKTCTLKPYPFNRFNAAHRYIENWNLDVNETGPKDLIQPCHEFKAFNKTPEVNRIKQFTYEVIRFAAACMNCRTNGTIHFGVADDGKVEAIGIQNEDVFNLQLSHAIEKHFPENIEIAKRCIKPPRFVEVLKADMTSAGKRVIEVDIEPSFIVCKEFHFNTYNVKKNEDEKKKKKKQINQNDSKSFFIRDSSCTRSLITPDSTEEYEEYIETENMQRLSQLRKDAEEKHLSVVKNSVQGSKLCEMITGGTQSLDRSHFTSYIVVANKSHPVQLENLEFLLHMKNLVAVLDFDPESAQNGLYELIRKRKDVNLLAQHEIAGPVEDVANRLKQHTSWVFCNGGINQEKPSDVDNWLTEKGSSVHDVFSFLCRNLLPHKKLLTIFLLLSQVSDANDPLLETFSMFLQELKGGNQILCISDNETTYTYWKDLIKGRYKVDISRCIYELSFAEVNGTVLSLWSENRKSKRFLPCGGGSKVVLSKEAEESLDTLSILCVNQCEGGNEDKHLYEENFYKGGKVSWWNFYFSEQPGSKPFIKGHKFDYIVSTMIPNILNRKRACEFFNIFHRPGCSSTTLAMHVLWTLKDKFRCAVLKDTTDDYTAAAKQVVQLLTYETKEKKTRLPVLLMADDFHVTNVPKLQHEIEEECLNQNIFSISPQVIIASLRVDPCEQTEGTSDGVYMPSDSETEKELLGEKMEEFKKSNTNTETCSVIVKNILEGFNFQHKHAQLFAVLVLLHVYSKNTSLSVSMCEEFLGLQTKPESCKVEDAFEKFSSLLKRCTVGSKKTFEGVRVIHSSIAQHCLDELSISHGVTKAAITNLLLTTDLFYKYALGKQKCMQDVHNMLVRRQYSAEVEDFFSPLIQDIMKETPGMEETVLLNATKCYIKDAVISQLLARYYIKKQDFTKAMDWATKAKDHSGEDSAICDTVSQVLLHELKQSFDEDKDDLIKPDSLDRYLTLAESAAEACKETQQTANKEAMARLQRLKDYNTYNTAGHLGELQTAATVIQILQKIPGFTYNNNLIQVFSRKITIEDLLREEPELKKYCDVLKTHKCFLQFKETMKQHFDFFKNIFVNLVPFFTEKDEQTKLTKPRVSKYFQQYTDLFCRINWSELVNNEHMNHMVKLEQTRQCLERNKGDSYSGLLEYLYEKDSTSTLEEIIQQYDFILKSQEASLKDTVNFIYANVILANINPKSQYIKPYQVLCELLLRIIDRPTPVSEILPLHYITFLLLCQENHHALQTSVSQMKTSYSTELKPLSNGKRAAVHFYLGKDKGYGGLISQRDINSCLESGQNISTQWDDKKIWKKVRDSKKLHRVSGEICDNWIWVSDVKVRSQLHKESGPRVTFFIGFSMNGPVALDIDTESEGSQA